jgi:hypothetical protein
MAGAAATYGLWNQWPDMPQTLRVTLATASALLTLTFTLVRIHGRGLDEWIFVVLHYLTTPRVTVWQSPRRPLNSGGSVTAGWEELNPELTWGEAR